MGGHDGKGESWLATVCVDSLDGDSPFAGAPSSNKNCLEAGFLGYICSL